MIKKELPAAIRGSRRLAHFSTAWNAGRLIFCVRYGYRSIPAAMAAERLSLSLICDKYRAFQLGMNNGIDI